MSVSPSTSHDASERTTAVLDNFSVIAAHGVEPAADGDVDATRERGQLRGARLVPLAAAA